MKSIISVLIFMALLAIPFSVQADLQDLKDTETVAKIWKEVQSYVDASVFDSQSNMHHVQHIIKTILKKHGIVNYDDFWVGVMGEPGTRRPVAVVVILIMQSETYKRAFEIKNVKTKGVCDDRGVCA